MSEYDPGQQSNLQPGMEAAASEVIERFRAAEHYLQEAAANETPADTISVRVTPEEPPVRYMARAILRPTYDSLVWAAKSEASRKAMGNLRQQITDRLPAEVVEELDRYQSNPSVPGRDSLPGRFGFIPNDMYADLFVVRGGEFYKGPTDYTDASPADRILHDIYGVSRHELKAQTDTEAVKPLTAADAVEVVQLMPLLLNHAFYKLGRYDSGYVALSGVTELLKHLTKTHPEQAKEVELGETIDNLCLILLATIIDKKSGIYDVEEKAKILHPHHEAAVNDFLVIRARQLAQQDSTL